MQDSKASAINHAVNIRYIWGSSSFPHDFMRFGVEGLQNDFFKAWDNYLAFVFWGGRITHCICACGSGSFPNDFMRFWVGWPPKSSFARPRKII